MKRRELLKNLALLIPSLYFTNSLKTGAFDSGLSFAESIAKGSFLPDWESLKQYLAPEWHIA